MGILLLSIFISIGVSKFFAYRKKKFPIRNRLIPQLAQLFVAFSILITLILNLPINETTRGQLLSLLGILLTAAIALSSTTFLGNIMAGLMLKALGKIVVGDFLKIEDNFGRVTEQGLLHTEIQTEDRDLTTLPNIYLVTNPVKVIRNSGTLLAVELSLGYDVHHQSIEKALIEAAEKTSLKDPFVQIKELLDHAVVYKAFGFLEDIKILLTKRSEFRSNILDALHTHRIEIVSPNFMNQRVYDSQKEFIPQIKTKKKKVVEVVAEELMFDKADEAVSTEKLKEQLKKLTSEIEELENSSDDKDAESSKNEIQARIDYLKKRCERITALLEE
ncbi:MAG: mechanosensitive ion channel family protein [Bacteriovoracaceae bacterium]|nr:mechanosensitive ion channel family protein [Bacteriovoracaceae bacterium]